MAAAALDASAFSATTFDLADLFGDERVPYTADRVYIMSRPDAPLECGCVGLHIYTLKDRTGPVRTWNMQFWGSRFYPALDEEVHASANAKEAAVAV